MALSGMDGRKRERNQKGEEMTSSRSTQRERGQMLSRRKDGKTRR